MLKIISFDLDGTLIRMDFADIFWYNVVPEIYARRHGLSIDKAKEIVTREYDRIGPEDIRWYDPEWWFRHFDLHEDPETATLRAIERDAIKLYNDAVPALKMARKYAEKVIIVTMQPRIFIRYTSQPIRKYVDEILSVTSDIRHPFKDDKAFGKVLLKYNVAPGEIAHVGDHPLNDFEYPRKIGINAYLLDRKGMHSGPYVVKDLFEFIQKINKLVRGEGFEPSRPSGTGS